MVRRLVEQQQVGLGGQRACQRGARQFAAREAVQRAGEILVGETEAADDRGSAVAPVVAARVLELACASRVAARGWRRRGRRRTWPLQGAELLLDRGEIGGARQHVLAQRTALCAGGRWSCSAIRVPFSHASSPPSSDTSPASARSSVVLPAPFGPASASRSSRSTLNETLSKRTSPESSFRSDDAMSTAMPSKLSCLGAPRTRSADPDRRGNPHGVPLVEFALIIHAFRSVRHETRSEQQSEQAVVAAHGSRSSSWTSRQGPRLRDHARPAVLEPYRAAKRSLPEQHACSSTSRRGRHPADRPTVAFVREGVGGAVGLGGRATRPTHEPADWAAVGSSGSTRSGG